MQSPTPILRSSTVMFGHWLKGESAADRRECVRSGLCLLYLMLTCAGFASTDIGAWKKCSNACLKLLSAPGADSNRDYEMRVFDELSASHFIPVRFHTCHLVLYILHAYKRWSGCVSGILLAPLGNHLPSLTSFCCPLPCVTCGIRSIGTTTHLKEREDPQICLNRPTRYSCTKIFLACSAGL